ncbi:hypothetical protein ACRYJU_07285 [Alloalcanivorax xenomutans]|uniref:hypothetical protein n=1 Tax=Alloalcanivorax xenomutans TaxID=1094342 RepID=UPI003D9AB8B9
MSYATELRQRQILSGAQNSYDNQLPEDDLDFLDTAEGEDFAREEEEELQRTGAGRVIGPEEFWQALCWDPEFRRIRDRVINELMDTRRFRQRARERMEKDAELRAEP